MIDSNFYNSGFVDFDKLTAKSPRFAHHLFPTALTDGKRQPSCKHVTRQRTFYCDDISRKHFVDPGLNANYPNQDYHWFYFGEILSVLKRAD